MELKIDLNLFATLSGYAPHQDGPFRVACSTTVGELVRKIGIPVEEVKLIFINGRKQNMDYILKDKDRVGLFPPVGGG